MIRPRFKPHFHVAPVDPQHVFLLSETRTFVLEGRAYRHLAALLDGTRSSDEILDAVVDTVPRPEALYALQVLERRGYLVDGAGDRPPAHDALWHAFGIDPTAAATALQSARLEVVALENALAGTETGSVRSALASMGLAERPAPDVRLVLTRDYEDPALDAINRDAIETGRPWLLAKPAGAQIWIGPVFVPGRTPCWHCLSVRLHDNRQVERYVLDRTGQAGPLPTTRASTPASQHAAAGAIVMELARWIACGRVVPDRSEIITIDLLALETARHVVMRRPHCPVCGTPRPPAAPGPLALTLQPKRFTADGGHRICTPEETLTRLSPHVSPISGVVTSLLRKDARENGVTFSYAAGHAFLAQTQDPAVLKANLRYRSGGKGMSDTQARVSAISEAIERASGVWRGDEPVVRASAVDLGDAAVPLRDVLLFSDRQYASRREWNRTCSPTHYHVVPEPFDDTRVIDWAPLWSLTAERIRYLPAAYCYYGHPEGAQFFCSTDANGTAAGNVIEEAILQGLLELIERDAVAVWWYNRLSRPRVDPELCRLPYTTALARHYHSIGREYWVLDLTHDLGIPVFAACSRRTDRAVEDIVISFGAHLDPSIALTRSLTEINQFLPAVSPVHPDGSTRYAYDDPDALQWWKTATVENQPWLRPGEGAGSRWRDFPLPFADDVTEDVRRVVDRLKAHGLETLVLDQTRPEIGHPVVRIVVPGLRHFWRRLAPGRLYDVPVALGWRTAPMAEEDVNPMSMFF